MSAVKLYQENAWHSLPARWNSETQDSLRCLQIRNETHDVKTFTFVTEERSTVVYMPGQFITLELDINGARINRCYTIASTPTRPHVISITVKRSPTGVVSNWLHDHLKVGDKLQVLPPAGVFSSALHAASHYLFLSAGSGITPLMSMLRAHYDLFDERDIHFIHSARTPEDIIFEQELDFIASQRDNVKVRYVCENVGRRSNWSSPVGMLTLALLEKLSPDFMTREIFVCGPEPYMKAIRSMLTESGFNFQHYHEESFSFETIKKDTSPTVIDSAISYNVHFKNSRRDIRCQSSQHVLEAARVEGVRLMSSCTQGMCGTCKVKLISGKVDMRHNGGIRQREIEQGMILLCCSKPVTDLVIDK